MKAGVLIQRSLNVSGIVARNLEEQDSEEGVEGLFWLNFALRQKSANGVLLPYFSHISIPAVVGQEVYFIPNLVTAEILTFTLQNVRYSVRGKQRNKYFGESRAENIDSLPYQWYWERVNGGMNIYLYFLPADAYQLSITGLTGFPKVTFDTELDDFLDDFYQNFFIFEVAQLLCSAYTISMPPDAKMQLKQMRAEIRSINPRDFSIKKTSMIGGGTVLTYMQVNLKTGWGA